MSSDVAFIQLQHFLMSKRHHTQSLAKGRCELKERHWKYLEALWEEKFSEQNPIVRSKAYQLYVKYHPSARAYLKHIKAKAEKSQ